MNTAQWLWYYHNLMEDERLNDETWSSRLDYLGMYSNYQLAMSVMETKQQRKAGLIAPDAVVKYEIGANDPNSEMHVGDTAYNNDFENELKRALKEAGEEFTELPSSTTVGNVNENKDDFLKRAAAFQSEVNGPKTNVTQRTSVKESDDIDFFVYDD